MNHFRTRKNIFNHSAKEMTEFLYFEVLRLTVMYQIYETIDASVNYAKTTLNRPISIPFGMSDTDLKGILVYFDDVTSGKVSVSQRDQVMLNRVTVETRRIIEYLRKIRNGEDVTTMSAHVLEHLRRTLMIDSPKLRAMAALVSKWANLKSSEMKLLIDKIDHYGTLYLRHSMMTKEFRKLKKVDRLYQDETDKNKKINISAGDVLMGLASGMALKWSIDSRNKNRRSFDRLRDKPESRNHRK